MALHLARRGQEVRGLDVDAELVDRFNERAAELPAGAQVGDARRFELGRSFGLILAPMQLVQLFGGEDERQRFLGCVAAHLAPGGIAALAIVERLPEPVDDASPLPDAREVDGWVYSSLPLEAATEAERIRVRRLRQIVSPTGVLNEEVDEVVLQRLDAGTLEREAVEAGLAAAGRRAVPPTEAHVGSTAVLLRREP